MSEQPPSIYLERRTYRRRRMTDAVRMVPILGVFLFLIPLLWSPAGQEPAATARGFVYLFAIWAGLIVLTAVLSHLLQRNERESDETPK